MDDTDLSTPMLARIRDHLLVSLLGLFVGIAILAGGALLGGLIFGAATPGWWRGLTLALGIATIPIIGLTTAFRFLRCPGCNGLVAFQISGKASLLAGRYSDQCRHCGKRIFDGRFTRRFRVVQAVVFFGTILFFTGLAALHGGH